MHSKGQVISLWRCKQREWDTVLITVAQWCVLVPCKIRKLQKRILPKSKCNRAAFFFFDFWQAQNGGYSQREDSGGTRSRAVFAGSWGRNIGLESGYVRSAQKLALPNTVPQPLARAPCRCSGWDLSKHSMFWVTCPLDSFPASGSHWLRGCLDQGLQPDHCI